MIYKVIVKEKGRRQAWQTYYVEASNMNEANKKVILHAQKEYKPIKFEVLSSEETNINLISQEIT